ncbi:MAG: dTDP-glucose 4,6-dehydratase [Planctomycetota bacterium]
MKTVLVTGGAGFIGSCFIRQLLSKQNIYVVNLDKLTYAGHLESIRETPADRYSFVHGGIEESELVSRLLLDYSPEWIVHFAAEPHVDRSIDGSDEFLQTNVMGTVNLLNQARSFFDTLDETRRQKFRFLHVSTDEVFGSLGPEGKFTESSAYRPNSPYSASKASSDMFVRSYRETYGLPTLITNCSNNYGPYQFPEKLIPLMILNAAQGKELPIYGNGQNIRDWLYVEDHCSAIQAVLEEGRIGEMYNIGGDSERTNVQVVETICDLVDQHLKLSAEKSTRKLIRFVKDRPGHDRRYAIDSSKIQSELGWTPSVDFKTGLRQTVQWYLKPNDWLKSVSGSDYQRQRLGVI